MGAPFVIQLIGEYVIEILQDIYKRIDKLGTENYRKFLIENPDFFITTKQRVSSYWDCFHRGLIKKEDYVGFQLTNYFDKLVDTK